MPKTTDELARELGLVTYDTALPQDWIDDVVRVTGRTMLDIVVAGYVWCYDKPYTTWGRAVPLTDAAKAILDEYNDGKGTYHD